jgi:hypothetical protein
MTAALHYSQHAASKTSEIEKYSIIALCSMIGALPNSAWLEGLRQRWLHQNGNNFHRLSSKNLLAPQNAKGLRWLPFYLAFLLNLNKAPHGSVRASRCWDDSLQRKRHSALNKTARHLA